MKKSALRKIIREEIQEGLSPEITMDNSNHPIMYNKSSKTFVGEMSDIPELNHIRMPAKSIKLCNSKTGNCEIFVFTKADMDNTNEDTYGWNYQTRNKKYNLLIIND